MTNSKMDCAGFDAALPDYLEEGLDETRRAAVDAHLSECVRCASLLRDLENIRKDAAALPELVPSRDLWQGIEARISAPVIPLAPRIERVRRLSPAWMGIAAAALITSTAGVTYMLTSRSIQSAPAEVVAAVTPSVTEPVAATGEPNPIENPAAASGSLTGVPKAGGATESRLANPETPSRTTSQPVATFVNGDQARSDVVYGREIEMLQKIVGQRRTLLDSATVAIIERNLKIIDAAIEQSRAALARDPASRLLGEQLTHALDMKVGLLRTAAMLPART